MLATLPTRAQDVLDWTWPEIEPYYAELKARPVDAASIDEWLRDWSRLSELVGVDLEDLDLNGRVVRVLGKGAKERLVPLNPVAADAIRAWMKDR